MVKLGLTSAFEDIKRLHWFSRKQRCKEPHSPEYLSLSEEMACSAPYPETSTYSWIQSTPFEKNNTGVEHQYLRGLGPPTGASNSLRPRNNPYAPSTPSPLGEHSWPVQQPMFLRPDHCSSARSSSMSPTSSISSLPLTAETCSYIKQVVKTQIAQVLGKMVDENATSDTDISYVETDIESVNPGHRERPRPIFFRPDYSPISSHSSNSLNLDKMQCIEEISDEESFCDFRDKLSDAVVPSRQTTPEPDEVEQNTKIFEDSPINWDDIARTATRADFTMKRFSIPAWMDSSRCLERLKQNDGEDGNTGPQVTLLKSK